MSESEPVVFFDTDEEMFDYLEQINQRAREAMKNLTETQQLMREGLVVRGFNAYGESIWYYLFTLEEYLAVSLSGSDEEDEGVEEYIRESWRTDDGWYRVAEVCVGNMGIVEISSTHITHFKSICDPQEIWYAAAHLGIFDQLKKFLGPKALERFERYDIDTIKERVEGARREEEGQ